MDSTVKIREYYNSLESRWGYKFLLGDAKHFGFYPDGKKNISEREALVYHQDKIASALDLKSIDLVLDAGCGRGVTATYLAKKYDVHIVGIDLLDFEIEIAKQKAKELQVTDKTDFQVMDFAKLSFPDNYFDAVYTSETLSHAPDLEKVLAEFYRVLKPGGRIALFEYTIAQDQEFTQSEMESLDYVIDGSGMFGLKNFRHGEVLPILTSVGFAGEKEEYIGPNVLPSLERLYRKSHLISIFVRMFGLEKYFFNTVTPSLLMPLVKKLLIKYWIFTATKPRELEN